MKIFGIGLSKSGTNSLTEALTILGYNIAHYPGPNFFEELAGNKLDGCTDLPTALRYQALDKKFPGSKFILTRRDRSTWLQSVRDHFQRRPASTLGEWGKQNRKETYGSLVLDKCNFAETHHNHHNDIFAYFGDRKDLLILDLESDSKWEDLCAFLGHDIPSVPYPHGNSKPSRTNTVDVVYPYASSGDSWEELRYSIRSVANNFLDLRDVWIVGDTPEWLANAHLIPKTRTYSDNDIIRNFDYTQSILWAAMNPEISDPFLAINDDHYLLAPMTATDISERCLVRENMDAYSREDRNTADRKWQLELWRQYDRLKQLGLSGWNFECHTPVLVSKENIINTWAFFGYGDGRLIWKTAYFNMFPPANAAAHLSEVSGHKAGIYKVMTYDEIKEVGDAAIYLNHNDEGINEALKRYLQERFPSPSVYEVPLEDKSNE
jgi:hypothetical protein